MVVTRGSGSGASGSGDGEPARLIVLDVEISDLIAPEVATDVHGVIPNMFGSVKTAMIELFDDTTLPLCRFLLPQPLQPSPPLGESRRIFPVSVI